MKVSLVIFCIFIGSINCSNILFLASVPSPSHYLWNRVLANGLASNNHNVTIISFDFDSDAPDNVHYIHLERGYDSLYGNGSEKNNDILQRHLQNSFAAVVSFYKFGYLGCKGARNSDGLKFLINYPVDFKFDLVIYDFTCGPCLLGLLHRFGSPPLMSVSAFNTPAFHSSLIGGHKNFAYIPHFAVNYGSEMSFMQRCHNYLIHLFDIVFREYVFLPKIQWMTEDIYDRTTPQLDELEKRTSLMLVNSNPAIDFSESLPPNVISVGGLQVLPPKPLQGDLKEFIEGGKKGSVLFAMGTNFKSSMLTIEMQRNIVEAFKSMPSYNFVWKFDKTSIEGIATPKNLKISKWLPQNDILAHDNVVGFISHCGLLSTHEAYWYAVPIIGIPVYADQKRNFYQAQRAGVAKMLALSNLTVENIRNTVREVLEKPKYQTNMNLRSKHFRDQPELPLERALWWVEWLLRNPDSDHLKSPANTKLNGFQSNSYDVMFVMLVAIILLVFMIRFVVLKINLGLEKCRMFSERFKVIKKDQ
ncbi:unnamed protein product [Diamesa hyperborea]